jgi:hypothetical protein
MRTMCRVLPVLVLASVALGQDRFPAVLKALNLAREKPFSPGARARVAPALEEIVGLKDARAIQPLAAFVVQTLIAEDRLFREMIETQKRGAKARRRSDEIETQLKHLDVRLRAGATDVAPQIDALKRERDAMDNAFRVVSHAVDAQQRAVNYARDLRDDLVTGCVTILRVIKSEQVPAALIALSRSFDIAKEHETLLLVRMLRGCKRAEAAKHLIEIVTHPTVATGPRRQAASALATLPGREGIEVLIKLWERDPKGAGAYVRHALSLAAKRQLKDVSAAREWAKTLK